MHALQTVPFHGHDLYLVEHNAEPFTPMRPIVEGMGLYWSTQRRKLDSNRARWGVVILTTPSAGGTQEMLCLPLRKLPGWMMTVSPNKVSPKIRERVVAFQDECDDVLWQYWTKGRISNPTPVLPSDPTIQRRLENVEAQLDALQRKRVPRRPQGIPHGWDIPSRLQLYFGHAAIGDETDANTMLCLLKLQVPAEGGFNPSFEGFTLSERAPDGVTLVWDVRGLMKFLVDYGVNVAPETQARIRTMTMVH